MQTDLQKLISDMAEYRSKLDGLFSTVVDKPQDLRTYFFEILVLVAQLYVNSLFLGAEISRAPLTYDQGDPKPVRLNGARANHFRDRFETRLRSLRGWNYFEPQNAFSGLTGLRTLQDYIEAFSLHLPEVYEETLRLEQYASDQLGHSGRSTAPIEAALQHMGRNHILFVLQPLQWAADEDSWREE